MDPVKDNRTTEHKKRIRRLRRIIVSAAVFLLILPTVLSVIALVRIGSMNARLDEITTLLNNMNDNMSMSVHESEEPKSRAASGPTPLTEKSLSGQDDEAGTEDENTAVKKVYLTFDDGPSQYTDDILDILAEYDVKATFFVNGREGFDAEYMRIALEGHSIGMHSYSHVYDEVYSDLDSFAEDLHRIQQLIKDITGEECRLYRFPGGSSNAVHHMPMAECIEYLCTACGADPTGEPYRARMRETIHTLLSDEPGCFNCDGFKVDFANCMPLGKYVTPHEPVYGVELLKRMYRLLRDCAKAAKPDALINCSCAHPYFDEIADQVRLHDYDGVLRSAPEVMGYRAKLVRAAMEDVLLDTDSGSTMSHRDFRRYVAAQPDLGVPCLMHVSPAGAVPLDGGDLDLIREAWARWEKKGN